MGCYLKGGKDLEGLTEDEKDANHVVERRSALAQTTHTAVKPPKKLILILFPIC